MHHVFDEALLAPIRLMMPWRVVIWLVPATTLNSGFSIIWTAIADRCPCRTNLLLLRLPAQWYGDRAMLTVPEAIPPARPYVADPPARRRGRPVRHVAMSTAP